MTSAPQSAAELHEQLRLPYAERALADLHGLSSDGPYVADLSDEIEAFRHAYVGTAVTEIAVLRGELSGRLTG